MSSMHVPKAMQGKFESLSGLTDAFCASHLNAEYAELARRAVAALCRKRPSPVSRGRDSGWACGVIHALGMVNFLFDSTQIPHLTAREVYEGFGITPSTGGEKSRAVREALRMDSLDPSWTLPSQLASNPMVWMVRVDGLVVDARTMPFAIQGGGIPPGLDPHIPARDEDR